MKFIIKALLFTCVVAAAGCSKELNTTPTVAIDASNALKTSSDVKAALAGAYAAFGDRYFYGGRILMEADFLGDNNEIDWQGTYQQLTQIHNKTIPEDNSYVTNNWLAGYSAINDANSVLASLSVVDTASRTTVEGEAKFLRSASFFELVKMFAKDWSDRDRTANPVFLLY